VTALLQVGENVQAVLVSAEVEDGFAGGRTRVGLSMRLTTPDPLAQTLDDLLAGLFLNIFTPICLQEVILA
jgi:hypothetical protein